MHELSIAENLLEIVLNAAHGNQAKQVKTIHMEIGELSCVQEDCLRFAFEVLSKAIYAAIPAQEADSQR